MGGKVAEAGSPFFEWGGSHDADGADGALYDVAAAFAHFDNVLAGVALINATAFAPESTFSIGKNCLTLHRVLLFI
jgi:hypothetical protein